MSEVIQVTRLAELVTTTLGDMPAMQLNKRTIIDDNDNEFTVVTEYRLPNSEDIIHRSVHVTLKESPPAVDSQIGNFSG